MSVFQICLHQPFHSSDNKRLASSSSSKPGTKFCSCDITNYDLFPDNRSLSFAMSTATRPSSSATTSVILENPVSQSQPTERLVLRLNRKKKKVSWKDGTVDNEFMQKKSSKKCCIFHKQKPFDEDDSEEEEDNNHHHHHDHDHDHEHSESGEASSSNDSKAVA
ncbi:hypothetical protein CARUB_v10024209mg [Capsella rubella]|uniref:Protein phosphatase inhibitor n=2 Tax=Capsella rubella TaxID=81985 RepID=R0HVE4_9BRAS|nr:hypothetical protein CARUB_v10024209mg [Capsella rubella]